MTRSGKNHDLRSLSVVDRLPSMDRLFSWRSYDKLVVVTVKTDYEIPVTNSSQDRQWDMGHQSYCEDVGHKTYSGDVGRQTYSGDVGHKTYSGAVGRQTYSGDMGYKNYSIDVGLKTYNGHVSCHRLCIIDESFKKIYLTTYILDK